MQDNPVPTPPCNAKEYDRDGYTVGELLIDLAEDRSEDRTSTPAVGEADTIPPAPTEPEANSSMPDPTGKGPYRPASQ
jgi:hypothetical protein